MTFKDLMARGPRGGGLENWDELKANVLDFLKRLKVFNGDYTLLWHRLDSDNVIIETNNNGKPTGEIKIIDLNFTEKSLDIIKQKANQKMEEVIINPLLEYFEIHPVK